jgi:hypothetical protein
VKIRIVVPDQRNVPVIAGRMVTNGAVTGSGMRPSTTIGSEKTIRISLASRRFWISLVGPLCTTVSAGGCCAVTA